MISSLTLHDPTRGNTQHPKHIKPVNAKGIRYKALDVIGGIHCFSREAIRAFQQTERRLISTIFQLRQGVTSRFQDHLSQLTNTPASHIAFAALLGRFRTHKNVVKDPLDRNDLLKRLDTVQTFMVVNSDGTPYTFQSSTTTKQKISLMFLNSIDANQLLKKIQSDDSDPDFDGFVKRIYLSDFYEDYIMKASRRNKNPIFHFVPNEDDVLIAQSIQNATQPNKEANSPFLGVPVFFCDVFKAGTEMHTPYFLSFSDMHYALSVSAQSSINEKRLELEQVIEASKEEITKLQQKAKGCRGEERSGINDRVKLIQEDIRQVQEHIGMLPMIVESQLIPQVDSFESVLASLEKGPSANIKPWVFVPPNSVAPQSMEEVTTNNKATSEPSNVSSLVNKQSTA